MTKLLQTRHNFFKVLLSMAFLCFYRRKRDAAGSQYLLFSPYAVEICFSMWYIQYN